MYFSFLYSRVPLSVIYKNWDTKKFHQANSCNIRNIIASNCINSHDTLSNFHLYQRTPTTVYYIYIYQIVVQSSEPIQFSPIASLSKISPLQKKKRKKGYSPSYERERERYLASLELFWKVQQPGHREGSARMCKGGPAQRRGDRADLDEERKRGARHEASNCALNWNRPRAKRSRGIMPAVLCGSRASIRVSHDCRCGVHGTRHACPLNPTNATNQGRVECT